MKKHIMPLFAMLIVMFFFGCNRENISATPEPETSEPTSSDTPDFADVSEEWESMNAAFARKGSGQYNNATLMMKYLYNGCALFEFRLMEGSESEDMAFDTIISGVLIIDENGENVYETIPDAENSFSINFALSEDGQTVDVTHNGALEISPDGRYVFIENHIEVSDASSGEILSFLPTVATSLNKNLGAYTVNYPNALVSDWFYTVEAVFDDSGAVLAKFLIAKDLSAVFRADDDIEPVMIFGSAQPMMDAYVMDEPDSSSAEETGEDIDGSKQDGSDYEPRQLVYVTIDNGTYMMPKTSGRLIAILPADLPYTLSAKSFDETVAVVDENGAVTAVGEGETEIECVVTCEDGVSKINVPICVTGELDYNIVLPENENSGSEYSEGGRGDVFPYDPPENGFTLVADFSNGMTGIEPQTKEIPLPLKNEMPASNALVALYLADELSEWTGFDFTINDVRFDGDSVSVDWSADSTLIAGLDGRTQKEGFLFYDAVSLNRFMTDSLAQTLKQNFDIVTVYYNTDGKNIIFTNPEDMAAQGLPELPADQPYEGSSFFAEHNNNR